MTHVSPYDSRNMTEILTECFNFENYFWLYNIVSLSVLADSETDAVIRAVEAVEAQFVFTTLHS
jgi:hypothetical protein